MIRQTICASAQRHYLHAPRQKRVTVLIMLANADQAVLALDYQRVHFVMLETIYANVPPVFPHVPACQLESTVMLLETAEMGFVSVPHHWHHAQDIQLEHIVIKQQIVVVVYASLPHH